MKLTTLILTILLLASSGLNAQETFTVTTKDDEVTDIAAVQVEITEPVVKTETVTLQYLDTQIAVVQAKIAVRQEELAALQTKRAAVLAEAQKVKLKPVETIPVQ